MAWVSRRMNRQRSVGGFYGTAGYQKGRFRLQASYGVKRARTQPEPDSANITSHQFDQKQVYKAPKRSKRGKFARKRKTKWNRKVLKVVEETAGKQDIIIPPSGGQVYVYPGTSLPGTQVTVAFFLGTGDGASANTRDMFRIFSGFNATIDGTTGAPQRVYFEHSQIDWSLVVNPTKSLGVQGDIYELICRKNCPASVFPPVFQQSQIMTGGGIITQSTFGWDPFQDAANREFFRVLKVTRVQIPAGGLLQGRMSFSPKRLIESMSWRSLGAMKGFTRMIYFVLYGGIDPVTGTSSSLSQYDFSINAVRTYTARCATVLSDGSQSLPA